MKIVTPLKSIFCDGMINTSFLELKYIYGTARITRNFNTLKNQ